MSLRSQWIHAVYPVADPLTPPLRDAESYPGENILKVLVFPFLPGPSELSLSLWRMEY